MHRESQIQTPTTALDNHDPPAYSPEVEEARVQQASKRKLRIVRGICLFACAWLFWSIWPGSWLKGEALVSAIYDKDYGHMRFWLFAGADVNYDDDGRTPLLVATDNGDVEAVQILLAYHPDKTIEYDGKTAAQLATQPALRKLIEESK